MHEYIRRLVAFLEQHLCHDRRQVFKKLGERSFIYVDTVDVIFIKVTDRHMIIITDGHGVVDREEQIPLYPSNFWEDDITDDDQFDPLLQSILHKF